MARVMAGFMTRVMAGVMATLGNGNKLWPRGYRLSRRALVLSVLLALGGAGQGTAQAQTTSTWQFSAGVAAQTTPLYQGSDQQELYLLPAISAERRWGEHGRFFAGSLEGVGVDMTWSPLALGAAVGYRYGLAGADSLGVWRDAPAELQGMTDPGATATLKPYLTTLFPKWNARLEFEQGLSSDNQGAVLRVQLSANLVAQQRWTWQSGVQASWANQRYMDDYFSIAQAEARPDRRYFQAQSGVLQAGVFSRWQFQPQPQRLWLLSVTLQQLGHAISHSDLVSDRLQAELSFAYVWLF